MLPDAHPHLIWRQALAFVNLDVFPQPVLHKREIIEPARQPSGCPDARQVLVAPTEPGPSAHLHQRVVHHATPDVKAEEQVFQCQPMRKTVATDGDGFQIRLAFVVQHLRRLRRRRKSCVLV